MTRSKRRLLACLLGFGTGFGGFMATFGFAVALGMDFNGVPWVVFSSLVGVLVGLFGAVVLRRVWMGQVPLHHLTWKPRRVVVHLRTGDIVHGETWDLSAVGTDIWVDTADGHSILIRGDDVDHVDVVVEGGLSR